MLRPITVASVVLVIMIGAGAVSQAFSHAVLSAANGQNSADRPVPDHLAGAVQNHSVKLTWGVSVPASKSPRDAVVGYNVYRSTVSQDRNPKRITSKPCQATTYTDTEVEAGKTYFYVTRGVTANGVESGPSSEIKAVIPSP